MASNPFGGFLQKMKGFADEAKRKKYREQVERDIVLYKDKGFIIFQKSSLQVKLYCIQWILQLRNPELRGISWENWKWFLLFLKKTLKKFSKG